MKGEEGEGRRLGDSLIISRSIYIDTLLQIPIHLIRITTMREANSGVRKIL